MTFQKTFLLRFVILIMSGLLFVAGAKAQTLLAAGSITTGNQSVGENDIPATLFATLATGGHCSGSYQYQWQYSYNGFSYLDVDSSLVGDSLDFVTPLERTTLFRYRVVCGTDTAYTNSVTVFLADPFSGGLITTSSQFIDSNTAPPAINATAAANGNCNNTYTYQWQKSTDGYLFTDIAGASSQNLTYATALTTSTFFRRKTICDTLVAYTPPVLFKLNVQSPVIPAPHKNSIDTLLQDAGINIQNTFTIISDSVANGRPQPNPTLDSLDIVYRKKLELSPMGNPYIGLEQADLDELAADTLQDSIQVRLANDSLGIADSTLEPVFIPLIDDSTIQYYLADSNYHALDSLVQLTARGAFEDAAFQLEQQLNASQPSGQRTYIPSYTSQTYRRGAVINGLSIVGPYAASNTIVRYTGTFQFPTGTSPGNILWVVSNGMVVGQNTDPAAGPLYVDVQWLLHSPFYNMSSSVMLIDLSSHQVDVLPVYLSATNDRVYPPLQKVFYGQTPCILHAGSIRIALQHIPSHPITFQYQWQQFDIYAVSPSWTDIPGASSSSSSTGFLYPTYQPDALTKPWLMYRMAIKRYNDATLISTTYTSAVSIQLEKPDGGTITAASTDLAFNTVPAVTETASTGGYTPPGYSIQYFWEYSVNGAAWTEFGYGQAYPSYAIRYSNTRIRRKSFISAGVPAGSFVPDEYLVAYSNEINFTTHYASVDFENRNYIRENVVLVRGVEHWEDADLLANDKKIQTTTYLDGLSRPVQVVGKGTHYDETANQWYDLVQPVTYEAGGRVDKSLLPYATTDNAGKFKTNAATAQPAYYQSRFGESNAFGKIEYDESPLNQALKTYAPGDSWAGNNVSVSANVEIYQATSEKVRKWTVGYAEGEIPVSTQRYTSNLDLIKTWALDEKGKKVISYTDKNGNVILKKVQVAESAPQLTDQHAGWLCTYYVYDELNRLRFTLTPGAVKEAEVNSWVILQMIADGLCFWYDYDELGRVIAKKSPDKGIEYVVYDNRNRPILTQDANARAKGEWLAAFYDMLNRPVMTAIFKSTQTRSNLQSMANNAVVNAVDLSTTYGGTIQTGHTFFNATDLNNPSLFTQLSFNYYDGYGFSGKKDFDDDQLLSYNDLEAENSSTSRTAGMPTGGKTRVLDGASTPLFLTSTVHYDEEGRPVQAYTDNIKGGTDMTTTQYHFDGRILSTLERHRNPGTDYADFPILTKYKFDKAGRMTSIGKKINDADRDYASSTSFISMLEDDDDGYKVIARYQYNELGQLSKKILSPDYNSGAGLETIDYSYNLRGWLTGINKAYALAETGNQWDHYFGMYIGYDNKDSKFATAQLNGQIAGVQWKSQGDNIARKFDYVYDNANRLLAANFKQYNGSGWANDKMDFSTKDITYDENSNLLTLTHMGVLPGASSPLMIDQLAYHYNPKSNRLSQVTDGNSSASNGKLGDFKDGPYPNLLTDYSYDLNGNLTTDNNRDIRDAVYNYLDKPELIPLSNIQTGFSAGSIWYIYDAGGAKLQKIVTENPTTANGNQTIVTTTTYIGGYIYSESSTNTAAGMQLQMILHEEGRIRVITPYSNTNDPANVVGGGIPMPGDKQGVFDYFIKDHLENVRATITEEVNKASGICTMEDANTAVQQSEEAVFGNPVNNEVNATRDDVPNGWASAAAITGNLRVSKLQAVSGTPKTGPNALLRVMAGDKISARVDYYYANDPGSSGSGSNGVNALLGSLISSLTGGKATELLHGESTAISGSLNSSVPLQDFYSQQPGSGSNTDAPRAYMNWVFFDEQFNYVSQGSGFLRVEQSGDGADPLVMLEAKAVRNGYVYVYLSNESAEPVYFDNFTVSHERGQLLGEDHYYAYGLKIAALSSRSGSSSLNLKMVSFGYQGSYSEETGDFGLNYNEFFLRTYDPQIGRWTTPDPYDQFASPYVGMGTDPAMNTDPSGGVVPIWPPPGMDMLASSVNTLGTISTTASTVSSTLTITAQSLSLLATAGCVFSSGYGGTPNYDLEQIVQTNYVASASYEPSTLVGSVLTFVTGWTDENDKSGGLPTLDLSSSYTIKTFRVITSVSKDGKTVGTMIWVDRLDNEYAGNNSWVKKNRTDFFGDEAAGFGGLTIDNKSDGSTVYHMKNMTEYTLTIPAGNTYQELKNDAIKHNLETRTTFDYYLGEKVADIANFALDKLIDKIPYASDVLDIVKLVFPNVPTEIPGEVFKTFYMSGQFHHRDYLIQYHPQSGVQTKELSHIFDSVKRFFQYK